MSADASAIQPLFDAIHEACSPSVWSRGVELVRAEAVSGEASSATEITLRVSTRGGLVSPLVTLYPADADWECSCKGEEDPCEHVAAAAIALRQARKQGLALPAPQQAPGRIRYRLREEQGQLCLEREIAGPDGSVVLASMLDAVASGRVAGPRFVATPRDIAVERALGSRRRGAIPRETMRALFEGLAGSSEVDLDGVPVQVSAEPVLPHARVVDAPGGVRLYVEQDPSITRVFRNGAVLCADVLRRVAESRLSGRELEELPRGRFYAADQLAELVTEVLPSLQARIPVEIRSQQLPRITESEPPRILLEVERRGDKLSILPTLVYGTPPCARIDAGRLVHLQGPIPVRDEVAERARLRHLRSELGLQPGHRIELEGEAAIDFAAQLAHWRGELRGDAHRAFHRLPELVPRVSIEDGERFSLDFELSQVDASQVLRPSCRRTTPRRTRRAPLPRPSVARRRPTCCVAGARALRWYRSWAEASRRFPPTGSLATGIASPICSLRATPAAACPPAPCPTSGVCATTLDQPPPARLEGLAAAARHRGASRP